MRKQLLSLAFFVCLLFSSCAARTPLGDTQPSEVSSSCSEQSSQHSETASLAEAEAVLMEFYKPMLICFPSQINTENPLTPDDAYGCFQSYALAERMKGNKFYDRWESWLVEGEQLLGYDQYYFANIVEDFAKAYLSISAEDMREISFYNANLNAYEVSMWGGSKDTSTLKITDRICKDDRYTFNGIYDSGYGQTGEFTITLKKTETGFCLEAFESSFFE